MKQKEKNTSVRTFHSDPEISALQKKTRHRAWMNGFKFEKNKKKYIVVEGQMGYYENELHNLIRFEDENQNKFEMPEEMFFEKVKILV